jgi:hypothetical protein
MKRSLNQIVRFIWFTPGTREYQIYRDVLDALPMMLEACNQTGTQGDDAIAVLVLRQSKFTSIVRPSDE